MGFWFDAFDVPASRMGDVDTGENDVLELFESNGDDIYELFRKGRTRRRAAERSRREHSVWRFRITIAAVMAIVSFTLLTALRFLPVH